MTESYFTTLTNTGKALFANAPVLGTNVSFASLAVGDGNGSYAELNLENMLKRTALINEVWRGSINHIANHEENSSWIVVEGFIPSDVGDFDIREVGLLDPEGNLLAIGKYPHTYKPMISQGASKDLYVKMILEVTETALVTLKVDPTVVIATRKHVADELAGYPSMVRKDAQGNVAITGNVSIGGKEVKAAAHADIVGVVSQSGGVPTGAIIEKGSNANGEYIRWADGTLVCTNVVSKLFDQLRTNIAGTTAGGCYLGIESVTFPAEFINNTMSISVESDSEVFSTFSEGITASTAQIGGYATATGTWNLMYIAIGRWF